MKTTSSFCAVTLGFASLLSAQAPAPLTSALQQFVAVPEAVVALTHVRVVDGDGVAPVEDQTVVIANGKIQAVGRFGSTQPPAGARVMDLNGHTVIPGIVGLHDHSFYGGGGWPYAFSAVAVPRLYLASGVTTIRTTGSLAPYDELNLWKAIERGQSVGPRMFITGPYLNSGVPGLTAMVRVDSAEDARRVVRYWAEEGVTWIKAYANINRAALGAAIDEAHKHGVKVTAHLCSVGFREAVALGIDQLEHGLLTNLEYHPNKKPDECPREPMDWSKVDVNSPQVQQTFKDMVSHNVGMTSTLAVYEISYPNRPPLEQRVLDAMYEGARTSYLTNRARIPANRSDVPLKKAMEYDLAFVKAGGLLAAGVDPTGNGGALPGYGDQRNYELLIEAGFTPVQAIQILTSNGAKVLGKYDEFGTVTAGKSADLVVIKGNPIATPAEMRNVVYVFKQGVGYDSPKLIESVKGQVGLK
ncbi:MAG: amidohydrolase family protein [Gemmatimonadetes bacterium]|nr:amidohydrolase family protein [Gemmatimonadota bacterium]